MTDQGLFAIVFLGTAGVVGAYWWARDYLEERAAMRSCPRCGRDVRKGEMTCPHCDFDFWTMGAEPTA